MGIKDPFQDKASELAEQEKEARRALEDQASERRQQAQDEARTEPLDESETDDRI